MCTLSRAGNLKTGPTFALSHLLKALQRCLEPSKLKASWHSLEPALRRLNAMVVPLATCLGPWPAQDSVRPQVNPKLCGPGASNAPQTALAAWQRTNACQAIAPLPRANWACMAVMDWINRAGPGDEMGLGM